MNAEFEEGIGTVVFDLDGTLVDSVPDLAAAANRMLVRRSLPVLDELEVTAMVGDGVAALVRRVFASRRATPDDAAQGEFLADYTARSTERTVMYPGVADGLGQLRAAGWHLAVCTNKPVEPARHLLRQLGLLGWFVAVTGGDSFAIRKPDPEHVLQTLALTQGCPGRAVMVGDSGHDMRAGHGAGLRCIHAGWGYGAKGAADEADAVAWRFDEVPGLVAQLLGGKT